MIFQQETVVDKNVQGAASSRLPREGTLIAGKYRIECLLDCGNMGAVFRALHEEMQRTVALKCLLPRLADVTVFRERFMREARAAARIRHPNVVHIYDIGEHDGLPFIVMELLEGEAFDRMLATAPPLEVTLPLLLDAMRGVAAAHAENIVHRDVKPGNIFIVRDALSGKRSAKVLDFGISKHTDERELLPPVTGAGETIGTPQYMSLEQLRAAPDIDARSDVYAFGVILYELLTGRYPFATDSLSALAQEIADSRPVLPTGAPVELNAVVLKALAGAREQRYQTLGELGDALSAYLAQQTAPILAISLPEPDYAGRARSWLRRLARGRALASTGIVLGTVWLFICLNALRDSAAPTLRPQPVRAAIQVPAVAQPSVPEQPLAAAASDELAPVIEAIRPEVPVSLPKPSSTRRKRSAKPTPVIEAEATNVARGQRSGMLRRDAL